MATDVEGKVAALEALDLQGLREAWSAQIGPAPKLRSPDLLRRMLAWRLQAAAYGGLDETTLAHLGRKAANAPTPPPDVGVRVVREWKGQRHEAEVIEGGAVLYRGQRYASLSEVARTITGTRWNGPRFFGLRSAG